MPSMDGSLFGLLERIVPQSSRLLNADRAAIYVYDPGEDTFRCEVSVGLSRDYLDTIAKK